MKGLLAVKMVVVVAMVLAFGVQNAFAALDADDDIKVDYWSGRPTQDQGPFAAKIVEDNTAAHPGTGAVVSGLGDFLTFGVEVNDNFNPGYWYNIDQVNGHSATTLKKATGYAAFAYSKFLMDYAGPLGWGQGVGPGNGTDVAQSGLSWTDVMNTFQNAIWAGMVTNTSDTLGGSASEYFNYHNAAANLDGDKYTALGISENDFDTSGWGGVTVLNGFRVLNLSALTHVKQDMSVMLPGGSVTSSVNPEPASLVVWSALFASAMLFTVWRRRRK